MPELHSMIQDAIAEMVEAEEEDYFVILVRRTAEGHLRSTTGGVDGLPLKHMIETVGQAVAKAVAMVMRQDAEAGPACGLGFEETWALIVPDILRQAWHQLPDTLVCTIGAPPEEEEDGI